MTIQEQTSPKIELEELKRAKNAFNISVITSVLFVLIVAVSVIINGSFATDIITLSVLALGAVVAAISAVLSRRGKSDLGILLLIATLVVIVASRVFVQKGLAIPTGIVHIILVSGIAVYTLPQKWIGRVITLAFLNAVVTVIADQFTVGVPVSSQPQAAIIIASILGLIYLVILVRQFPSLPLQAKLIIGFLVLTTLPLIFLGWQANSATRAILVEQVKAKVMRSAQADGAYVQSFAASQITSTRNQARLTELVDYMSLSPNLRAGSDQERLVYEKLATISKTDVIYIKSYALIDTDGMDILDTESSNISKNFSEDDFFKSVIADQKLYISGLILSSEPGVKEIYFAAPVISKSNEMIGILLIRYNGSTVQTLFDRFIRNTQAAATNDEYTFVVDDTNFFVLGHLDRVDLVFKSYLGKDDPRIAKLLQQGLIDPNNLDSILISEPELVANLSKMETAASFTAPSWEYNSEQAQVAAIRIPNTHWIMVTGQPASAITTLTQSQTRGTVITSIVVTALAALIAIIVSSLFTSPLLQLTKVAENISTGDFTQKANIRSKDEIGVLATTFNNMSSQIQELVSGLEKRVEQRTSELEHTSKQSEKRAQDLQTIAEIARYISTEKDLDHLLPLVTRIVSDRFGFYHVGIFLLDETGKFAVLRASNSQGGQEMLQRQHRLEVGQTGIVGNVTSTGAPRIALDTGSDAIYFNNPNLPDTRSEMALPLTARGSIIGALDVQSTVPNAFTDADVSILSLLADQVAIAIDNVRLIGEAQSSLAESQAVFSEYLSEAWQRKTNSGVLGYHQTINGGKVITDIAPSEMDIEHSNGHKTLEIPIRVRGQVIGALNIRSIVSERNWSDDDVNVVEAVAERLGLALDNARLFEETSTRASRERLVTEITTKIRGTNNPQEMIKTAVEELQRALGATRVEIVPQKATPPLDK